MIRPVALIAFGLWAGLSGSTQTPADFEHDIRALTKLVRERYSYLEHRTKTSGLDLGALEREALVRVDLEPTLRGFRRAVERYAAGLLDGHGGAFVPGWAAQRWRELPLSFVDVAEGVVVDKLDASIAAEGRVQRGDFVVAVASVPIRDAIERAERFQCASTPGARRAWAIRDLTRRREGKVALTLRRGDAAPFTVELATLESEEIMSQSDDRLRRREVGVIEDGVAYYRPGSFAWPRGSGWHGADPGERKKIVAGTMRRMAEAFERFREARALVLDLRRNPGGTDLLGQALVAHLVEPPYKYFGLGSKRDGKWSKPHFYAPKPDRREPVFRGELVVLIDERTFSTASNVAACLRDVHPKCTFIGRRDGAGTGAPRAVKLPRTKTYVHFCTMRVYAPNGSLIEGIGVTPDIIVRRTRAQLLAGEDAMLAAAAAKLTR